MRPTCLIGMGEGLVRPEVCVGIVANWPAKSLLSNKLAVYHAKGRLAKWQTGSNEKRRKKQGKPSRNRCFRSPDQVKRLEAGSPADAWGRTGSSPAHPFGN